MIQIRKHSERGHFDHGWLETWHTFSFAEYYDAQYSGFRCLRVINEDKVKPGQGFGRHSHQNMEILTYVLEGSLAHEDSLGNGSQIVPGEVQRMSAGSGITHSEFNHTKDRPVHLLQIWIVPATQNASPSYEQKMFRPAENRNRWMLIASPDGMDNSVRLLQDVRLWSAHLDAASDLTLLLRPKRYAWIQVVRGSTKLNGLNLQAGDGAALSDEPKIDVVADAPSEVLCFDLP